MPYRTGYEEIIGSRVDDLFVVTADDDGIVTDVKKDSLTVLYKGDIKKVFELGVTHGTVTGTTIPHNRITDLVVGHRFVKGDALVFNSGFFKRSEINKNNVIMKSGVPTRVMLIENSDTAEDGSVISRHLAGQLETPVTTLHGVIVNFDSIIHNLIKVGTVVEPDTILCTLENYINDNISAKDAEAIAALNKISKNSPRAKVYGTVTEIQVLYFGDFEKMHFSLQQIATEYDSERARKNRRFDLDNAKTGKIDESIRVAGKKLLANQMVIKVYIDSILPSTLGDLKVYLNPFDINKLSTN